MSSASPDFVTALARGLKVLQAFDAEHSEMTLSEIAVRANIAPATARRSLMTLKTLGFVTSNRRHFLLTPRVLKLSDSFLSSMNLQQFSQQYLQDVRDRTGDNCSMAVFDQGEVVFLASAMAKGPLQLRGGIGTRYPAYATALGRVLLAHLSDGELDATLAATQLRALTSHTVTDETVLRGLLLSARAQGYASVLDELDYGVVSVAVPIRAADGTVLAALNCSSSPSRIARQDMIDTRVPLLRTVADRIGADLARSPALLHALQR